MLTTVFAVSLSVCLFVTSWCFTETAKLRKCVTLSVHLRLQHICCDAARRYSLHVRRLKQTSKLTA